MIADAQKTYTILIVEDLTAVLDVLADKFKREGFTVYKAANGKAGLNLAKKNHPRVILADILMPYMNGITMCKLLEMEESTHDIPIVLLSILGNGELPKERLSLKNLLACFCKIDISMADIVEWVKKYIRDKS
jgi:CheY-like chemotaxis protein